MPRRSPTTCAEPGCPRLTRGRRCADHQRDVYRRDQARRGTTTERGLGYDHQQLTAQTIARQPWCSICGQSKRQVEARGDKLTGGHIIDRALGGQNIAANYRTECGRCNYGHKTDPGDAE